MTGQPTAQAPPTATDVVWSRQPRLRDRTPPTAQRVIAIEPVTDAIRAIARELPASSRYVATISQYGTVFDVLSISADGPDTVPALREYAIQASLAFGYAYYETGLWCDYCGRLCMPDVAFDHARWLRNNEGTWVA